MGKIIAIWMLGVFLQTSCGKESQNQEPHTQTVTPEQTSSKSNELIEEANPTSQESTSVTSTENISETTSVTTTENISEVECKPATRIRYRFPHVENIKDCEPENQSLSCTDAKAKWTGQFSYEVCSTLNYVQLNIPKESMEELVHIREQALSVGIILDEQKKKFDATLTVNGISYPVWARLKGDWTDHLIGDKWSFRIEPKKNNKIFGRSKFSIQRPMVRGGYAESFYLRHLKEVGVIAPQHKYIWYEFNNNFLGEMIVEDFFTNELLDSQGFMNGPMLGVDEDIIWRHRAANKPGQARLKTTSVFSYYNPAKILNGSIFSQTEGDIAQEALSAYRFLQESEDAYNNIYDKASVYNWRLITRLYGAEHGMIGHNRRFYFDPFLKKFRIMGYDGNSGRVLKIDETRNNEFMDPDYEKFVKKFLEEFKVKRKEIKLKIQEWAKEFIGSTLGNKLEIDPESILRVIDGNYKLLESEPEFVKKKQETIYPDPLLVYYISSNQKTYLEVINFTNTTVTLMEVDIKEEGLENKVILNSEIKITPGRSFPQNIKIEVPKIDHKKSKYLIKSKYSENLEPVFVESIEYVEPMLSHPYSVTLKKLKEQFPFIIVNEPTKIIEIPNGAHNINNDFIVPDGFGIHINAGTTLRISPGKKLISKNDVIFNGSSSNRIILTSDGPDSFWGGLLVLQGKHKSTLEYVDFENVEIPKKSNIDISGAVSFYENKVKLNQIKLKNIHAKHGLHFVRSDFSLNNFVIENSLGSAIGSNFSTGVIDNGHILETAFNGVEIQSSKIRMDSSEIKNVKQHGIIADRNSTFQGDRISMLNVQTGITSKNSSHSILTNSNFSNVSYPLVSINDSNVYEPSSLTTKNIYAVGFKKFQKTDLFSFIRSEENLSIPYKFFVAGHVYGKHGVPYQGIHNPLLKVLPTLENDTSILFGVYTGDMVQSGWIQKEWDLFFANANLAKKPFFMVLGNHDHGLGKDIFTAKYKNTFYYREINNDLFIFLDSTRDDWSVLGPQMSFLKSALEKIKPTHRNVFVFLHHLIWNDADQRFIGLNPNANNGTKNTKNFLDSVEPLFTSLNQQVYFFAGDMGAPWAKSCSYRKFGNVHYIGSGMEAEQGKDNYILVDIKEDGHVKLHVKALNGDDPDALGAIEKACE